MASQATIKQKATEHAARGEFQLAIEEYNKILSENDNDAAVHNLVGDAYLKMGNKELAIDQFERAIEIYAEDAFYSNAVAVCKKVLRVDGERASVYENLAELYKKQGLLGEAVANYKEFADRMKVEGDLEKVFVTYQKVKDMMPKKVDTRLALVDMYLARNRNDDAISELREVAKLFREQDKVEQAEEVEQRIVGLGGSVAAPRRVEEVKKPEPRKEEHPAEIQDDVDFYAQFQMVPPDKSEKKAAAAAAVAEPEPPIEMEAGPAVVEMAPEFEPAEAEPGAEIKFEQTMSDLEAERAALAAAEEKRRLEAERAQAAKAAPQTGDEELVVQHAEAQYEPIFKSSPTDWASYIELGDLCLSVGSTDEALEYYYKAGDAYFEEKSYDRAGEIFQKIAEIKPLELRPLQKLAQIAQKKGDKRLMIAAYTSLGECLDKRGADKEAEAVYRKLLAVDPNNQLARSKVSVEPEEHIARIIEEMPTFEPERAPTPPPPRPERKVHVAPEPFATPARDTISFDDVIAEVTSEALPGGAGAAEPHREGLMSMSELLQEFKEGVEENIPAADYSSHYDLGITYKEMGLLDEAIMEFTKASKGPDMAAKAFEMMGRILLEKKDHAGAIDCLKKGLQAKVAVPEEQIGLYYHLGRALESFGDRENAYHAYLRVKMFDPNFADISQRLEALGEVAAKKAAPPRAEEEEPKERPTKKKGKISYV